MVRLVELTDTDAEFEGFIAPPRAVELAPIRFEGPHIVHCENHSENLTGKIVFLGF